MRGNQPVTDLLDAPNGKRISQLLFGEAFDVEAREGHYSFGSMDCGYKGWLPSAALGKARKTSHRIMAMATFLYAEPDMKSDVRLRLPFMAQVSATKTEGPFAKTPEGYIFSKHLMAQPIPDFVTTAERLLGVPYLWGGRSSMGIDCSGLAQMALNAANIQAPRDSGPQAQLIGAGLPLDTPLTRGDLVFWNGHVGLMQDANRLLHATAFSMTVMSEPLMTTLARVKSQGYGGLIAVRRPMAP